MNIHSIYRPFLTHYRRHRVRKLYQLFSISKSTTIVDIGGNDFFWNLAAEVGLPGPKVTVVNICAGASETTRHLSWVVADGRRMPFKDGTFDIAFCNSVIEHLGNWESQKQFAAEISRVAKGYFVETPYRWFPVEPHFLTPLIHWLPQGLRFHLVRNFTLWGLIVRPSQQACRDFIREIRLLNIAEMKQLFPGGESLLERFFGIVKSVILLRRPGRTIVNRTAFRIPKEEVCSTSHV